MAKNLQDLLALLPDAVVEGPKNRLIQAMEYDSRSVTPETLFICLPGVRVDGHDFIEAAHRQGATAVLVERPVNTPAGMTIVNVKDTRAAMQAIAPYFFDYPGRKLRMIGVTGTNGKTTTTHLIRGIFTAAGKKTGLLGTIHALIGEQELPVHNTTPDVVDLQRLLAQMVEAGMEYAVMEVSSHALALDRIAGCEFDTGVFTNLTRDHLDFHKTFENYAAAKSRLFELISSPNSVKQGKTAVINLDDPASGIMVKASHCRVLGYGVNGTPALRATDVKVRSLGTSFIIEGEFGRMPLNLRITGMFNVYNVLAAVGAALAEGIDPEVIRGALEQFHSVPGRFELVDAGQPFSVIVDYAHTPDGLENILRTAREFAEHRIIIVFGCGGDRDRTKRPIMGELAARYADHSILTSDNPRSEDPLGILTEIEAGTRCSLPSGHTYEVIADRRTAIDKALKMAAADDIVIIAGKGHENYQILNDRTIHFDDREVAREIIREMK